MSLKQKVKNNDNERINETLSKLHGELSKFFNGHAILYDDESNRVGVFLYSCQHDDVYNTLRKTVYPEKEITELSEKLIKERISIVDLAIKLLPILFNEDISYEDNMDTAIKQAKYLIEKSK